MSAMPRDLARKRPANLPARQVQHGERGADGHRRAVRGGVSGVGMFRFCLLALTVCLFIGLLLSLLTPIS